MGVVALLSSAPLWAEDATRDEFWPEVGAYAMSDRSRRPVNRSRLDVSDPSGEWSWRYRNRGRLERDFALGAHSATAYVMAELCYDSRYHAWNRQR